MWDAVLNIEMSQATAMYVSAVALIGIFFEFHRVWSLRNLDLMALLFYAPGVLWFVGGFAPWGHAWLLIVSSYFLVRLLLDQVVTRRPLVEPNLSPAGLIFTAVVLLVILSIGMMIKPLSTSDFPDPRAILAAGENGKAAVSSTGGNDAILDADASWGAIDQDPSADTLHPPGHPFLHTIAHRGGEPFIPGVETEKVMGRAILRAIAKRTIALLGLFALLAGMLLIGGLFFRSWTIGLSAVTIYLLLPYSARTIDYVDHILPAAALVWAVMLYRWPFWAGVLIGFAAGLIFFPVFLLPLWFVFYGKWELNRRFLGGFVVVFGLLAAVLALGPDFGRHLAAMLGATTLLPEQPMGFWLLHGELFRWAMLVGFLALVVVVARRTSHAVGSLICGCATLMLAVQFWHPYDGGTYLAWFMPLLLLTVLRPNLPSVAEDEARN